VQGLRRPLGRLEQLDRIAVRVSDLDLLAARAGLHLVAEARAVRAQLGDGRRQVAQLDPVRSIAAGAQVMIGREAEPAGVERNRAIDVLHQ
jgi:hypothetical protein